jgi:hypothetical protein
VNFAGWVLRNLGDTGAGVDHHQEALACADDLATPEVRVAALEDLAEERLVAQDLEATATLLEQAEVALVGPLVFGWRLEMKLAMLRARLALAQERAEDALVLARDLRTSAQRVGVPRYASVAGLLVHQARAALGEAVDLDDAWSELGAVERSVAVEAWWWAGDTGAALREDAWLNRAEALADELARASGPHAESLWAEADRRLARWRRMH